MLLYLDVETIPCQTLGPSDFIDRVKVPGNYKKPEVIQAYKEDNAEAEWLKTSFDGMYGEIVSIAYAIEGEEPKHFTRDLSGSEADLLDAFFNDLHDQFVSKRHGAKPVWVGHNILEFDLRYLWQRCVINGIKPSIEIPVDAKPWGERVIDTLWMWKGKKFAGGSMDAICKVMGIPGKEGMSGADVWPEMQKGNYLKVGEYCADDVKRTREMYKRMTFNS